MHSNHTFITVVLSFAYYSGTLYWVQKYGLNPALFCFLIILCALLFVFVSGWPVFKPKIGSFLIVFCAVYCSISFAGIFFIDGIQEKDYFTLFRWMLPVNFLAFYCYLLLSLSLPLDMIKRFMLVYLVCTLTECCVGVYLMHKGIVLSPFWAAKGGYVKPEMFDYFGKKLIGLSSNVGAISQKIFISGLIVAALFKTWLKVVLLALLSVFLYKVSA